MRTATVSINDLFEFAGQTPPAMRPKDATLIDMAERQFAFLPGRPKIEVQKDAVTVSFSEESPNARQEAERLADRAGKRAAQGEHKKAIPIFNRVLELHPTLHRARRDLAMIHMELGDMDSARNHLIEVLRLNPEDAWSWVVLGNSYAKAPDWATAEKFLRRALEIAPKDPWALTGLGTVTAQTGRAEEAIAFYEAALEAKPGLVNALHGLALTHHNNGNPEAALVTLEKMFASDVRIDTRSQSVFDQGRRMFAELQSVLADQRQPEVDALLLDFEKRLERESGLPIRRTEAEFKDTTVAMIQTAWRHGRDHHLVRLRAGVPAVLRSHHLAHEFAHLEMETAARKAGRNRFLTSTPATEALGHERIRQDVRKLAQSGYPEESIQALAELWVKGAIQMVYNLTLDMVIETRLHERFRALRPAQLLSVKRGVEDAHRPNFDPKIREITPTFILRVYLALNSAYCLCLDEMYAGATDFAGLYRTEDTFPLARGLFRIWLDRARNLAPGDEYTLVDEFAEMLGLTGWYVWRAESGGNK